MTPEQESHLVDDLFMARRDGGTVDPTDMPMPDDIETAYRVQRRIAERFGDTVVGYKVGSTSAEAQRILGTDEPGAGAVLGAFLHESPARIAVTPDHHPAIEGEFAFRLGRDLPPRAEAYDRADLASAIDAVAGAIEVVGTRLAGGLAGKGRYLVTADGGANIALCIGPWRTDWRELNLPKHSVSVTVNGAAKGRGEGARALGDPMNVMIWLANRLSRTGEGLAAGMVISTGTCTGLDAVVPGDSAAADFGSLGSVVIDFAEFSV